MEYTPINSIADIDLANVTLRDINKRYIDRNGFRYATRFNLQTRKIEVVRVVKGIQEAQTVRQEISRQKQEESINVSQRSAPLRQPKKLHRASQAPNPDELLEFESELGTGKIGEIPSAGMIDDLDTGTFFEVQFMQECAQDFDKIRERINGIVNSIKNSGYFESNPNEAYNVILRDLNVECLQRCDNAVNYYRELTSYPRPASYYLTRMSNDQKARVDSLENDVEKMEMIRRLEVQNTFDAAYAHTLTVTRKLMDLVGNVSDDRLKIMSAVQQQAFKDTRVAVDFLVQNCEQKLAKIKKWQYRYS